MISRIGDILELQTQGGSGPGKSVPFAVKVCAVPTCNCQALTFILPEQLAIPPLGIESRPRTEFVIDWSEGVVDSDEVLSDAQQRRMNEFIKSADDADHEEFRRIFLERKRAAIFHASLDGVPANWSEDLDRTAVVSIEEIFPLLEILEFEHEGSRYAVVDCYCLVEGCDCREIVIHFAHIPKDPKDIKRTAFAAARYDLSDGSFHPASVKDAPQVGILMPQFLAKIPGVRELLKQRYGRIHQLVAEKPHIKSNRKASPVVTQPTPGRNDPCSCGSGKKYKKCCGA